MKFRLRELLPKYVLDKPTKFGGKTQIQKSQWRRAETVKHTDRFVKSFECRNVK